jgi:hypothetical protein
MRTLHVKTPSAHGPRQNLTKGQVIVNNQQRWTIIKGL